MTDYVDESVAEGALAAPVTGRLKIGSDDDLVRLNRAAWQVLERTGFKIYSKRIIEKVKAFGAKVDEDEMIARFPQPLIEETVDCELRPEPEDPSVAVPKEYQMGIGEVCFLISSERQASSIVAPSAIATSA